MVGQERVMHKDIARGSQRCWPQSLVGIALAVVPVWASAQASPFDTGANSLVTNFITLATPLAVLAVMGLGVAAIVGRISWAWPVAALVGIAVIFGAPQIVTWVRGMFGV